MKVLRTEIVSFGRKGKACKQHHCRLILYIIRLPSYESDSWRRYTLIGAFLVCWDTWEISLALWGEEGQVNSPTKKVTWTVDGLEVGENYKWCLVIVVIFMELGEAEVGRGEEILKPSRVRKAATRGPLLMSVVGSCTNHCLVTDFISYLPPRHNKVYFFSLDQFF